MDQNRIIQTFLTQSYHDAWSDYIYSLNNEKADCWDWVIITASNDRQAEAYQVQIDKRIHEGSLPAKTRFAVISDPEGKRVGSGGATLNVLKFLIQQTTKDQSIFDMKVAVFHSGGDSKRIPQYSACGKLFSPVPRLLPNGKRSTIFDELLISISGVPARMNNGMLVIPGDTVIVFNPLQLDLKSADSAALSIKTSITEGQDHGVFINGQNNLVSKFLHKKPESTLRSNGAVNPENKVDVDTGFIWFGDRVIQALLSLICTNGKIDEEKCKKYINDTVCLNFYADFVFPLAQNSTLEEYQKEAPEGAFTKELENCRIDIWNVLHGLSMQLVRMNPAQYIHFGTTQELYNLVVNDIEKYHYLGWDRIVSSNIEGDNTLSVNNALIGSPLKTNNHCYIEDSIIATGVNIGKESIVSGVYLKDMDIPEKVVLHCLELKDGKYVCRIYGINDNPKSSADGIFLNTTLRKILKRYNLSNSDIWDKSPASLWNAKLYSKCKTRKESIKKALLIYRISNETASETEVRDWIESERTSLESSFNQADVKAIIQWQKDIAVSIRVNKCITMLKYKEDMLDALSVLANGEDIKEEASKLVEEAKNAPFELKIRIYLALSILCKKNKMTLLGFNAEEYEDQAYDVISREIVSAVQERHPFDIKKASFVIDHLQIDLPVRVNFCGSPSDAAPYCLEYGGTMLDAALLLDGKRPIRAVVQRLKEKVIVFESFDLKAKRQYTNIKEIRNCGNPQDTFALHKAVLVAAGLIPLNVEDISLESVLEKIGGGLYLSTQVEVPKGSGLGTSSLVAAACIKAVNTILNQDISEACIYAQVFAAEQLMATGGGWQDQVGGLTGGIKLIRSKPGIYQDIKVDYLQLESDVLQELQDRFVLIFSGQRRLARNVLREELNQCIRNDKTALQALEQIQSLCVLMKYELERGNITAFAKYISEQFKLVKKLDKGASNTCIEFIFEVCDDLIDGKSICGAGGGGFLQVILKKGVSKDQLRERLKAVFQDCGVEVWDSTFVL